MTDWPATQLAKPCEVHAGRLRHAPKPLTVELHHALPRAWQVYWRPSQAPYPGHYDGQNLWDVRTVHVPPTCHRNVHYWIVRLMHGLADDLSNPAIEQREAVHRVAFVLGHGLGVHQREELAWAKQAPLRFIEAGGDVRLLVQSKLWGEA